MSNQVYSSGQNVGYFPNIKAKDIFRSTESITYTAHPEPSDLLPHIVAWDGRSGVRFNTMRGELIPQTGTVSDFTGLQSALTVDTYYIKQDTGLAEDVRGVRIVAKKDCVLHVKLTVPYKITEGGQSGILMVDIEKAGASAPSLMSVKNYIGQTTVNTVIQVDEISGIIALGAGDIMTPFVRFSNTAAPPVDGALVAQYYTQKPEFIVTKMN